MSIYKITKKPPPLPSPESRALSHLACGKAVLATWRKCRNEWESRQRQCGGGSTNQAVEIWRDVISGGRVLLTVCCEQREKGAKCNLVGPPLYGPDFDAWLSLYIWFVCAGMTFTLFFFPFLLINRLKMYMVLKKIVTKPSTKLWFDLLLKIMHFFLICNLKTHK